MATFIKRNGTLVPVKAFQKTGGGTVGDLTGTTWYFNEEVMADSLVHSINFISNNTLYSTINRLYWFNNNGSGTRGGGITPEPEPEPIGGQNYIEYGNDTVATGIVDAVQYPCTWTNNAYRTITITGGTDATNATLIAWLQNNATLVSGGASLSPVEISCKEAAPTEVGYLTFSSPNSFTIHIVDYYKYWNGTLEYSTDTINWSTWDGTTDLSSTQNGDTKYLYIRGSNNTYITSSSMEYSYDEGYWVLTGSNISCTGNIETLLDYQTVLNGNHPTMANYCYYYMFADCTALITAPTLPAIVLSSNCYQYMFYGCTSLTTAPALPATTLTNYCYDSMFYGCTSLVTVPTLPATTLASNCYLCMFYGCTSLYVSDTQTAQAQYAWQIPTNEVIGGTTMSQSNMFTNCLGTRSSNNFPGASGSQYTYYTQNQPVQS